MKLLVTGGAGFIGSNFIRYALMNYDWHIVNVDALTYAGNVENVRDLEEKFKSRYEFYNDDICSPQFFSTYAVAGEAQFDCIVNFAAHTHVDRALYETGSFIQSNYVGVRNLCEFAKLFAGKFVQISTDEVYGSADMERPRQFTEADSLNPTNVYAATKAGADLLALAYYKTMGLPIVITRSTNNYGPYQHPEKFIPTIISHLLEGKKAPVYGGGGQMREWLYVEDNVRAILRIIEKGVPGNIYNIGSGIRLPNKQVVADIADIMGLDAKECIEFVPDRLAHDYVYAVNSSQVRLLGWEPAVSYLDGLTRTIGWYANNKKWLMAVKSTKAYKDHYETHYKKSAN